MIYRKIMILHRERKEKKERRISLRKEKKKKKRKVTQGQGQSCFYALMVDNFKFYFKEKMRQNRGS